MKKLLQVVDDWLNGITMYALLLYGLSLLLGIALLFAATGVLSLSVTGLILSSIVIFSVGFVASQLLARLYRAVPNFESSLITCLILVFLLPPATTGTRAFWTAIVTVLALASKYLLTIRHKHIFNPAAFGVVVASLVGFLPVTWWVANPSMFPFVLVLGLLITRKVRRFQLVGVFVLAALLTMLLVGHGDQSTSETIRTAILSWPLVFLGTIMLTEPATMPPTQDYRLLFGLLVGVLFGAQLEVGRFATTPQLALIVGNIFAFTVSPRYKTKLTLKEVIQVTPTVKDFVFSRPSGTHFAPGQYMEWTIPAFLPDLRGNRRSFSLASSPKEKDLRIGVKFYEPGSDFKKRMLKLSPGDQLVAGQLAGDFQLPAATKQPLVFIAGGIGITPFRSMVQHMIDTGQERRVTLFYCINSMKEAAYKEVFEQARSLGVKVIYVVAEGAVPKHGYEGYLTAEILKKEVLDYQQRLYYISGPNAMVRVLRKLLRQNDVKATSIRTDFFSGY